MNEKSIKINATKPVFIVGCGNIGKQIATQLQKTGSRIFALSRSPETSVHLGQLNITPIEGDLDKAESLTGLPLAGCELYYLAPPPAKGEEDWRMTRFLAAISPENLPARVVYISTSGVYGDRGGDWVDETAAPMPQTDRARRRLHAEESLQQWGSEQGVAVVILRVGGIYSPDRLPVERLRQGTPVLREEECGYTNRIHAADLARICIAAMRRGGDGEIYNVSDGHPGTMTGYFNAVADALGLPRPPALTMSEAEKVLSPAMLSYLTESRRLENQKMITELDVELHYPDLESGLRSIGKTGD